VERRALEFGLMPVKLALVARTDLGMGRGKLAAQVAHAAVAAVLHTYGSETFAEWIREGQPKVVLKVSGEDELLGIGAAAEAAGLPVELIRDAGRRQLEAGSLTCGAIGPAVVDRIDEVAGSLSLL
jgi:PTH2 family peptidyl-tRNA hydrolase